MLIKRQVLAFPVRCWMRGRRRILFELHDVPTEGRRTLKSGKLFTDGAASLKGSERETFRRDIQKADILSSWTQSFSHLTKEILVEVLNERSTDAREVQTIVEEEGTNWMTPIINYLEEGIVLSDKNEARSLRPRAVVRKAMRQGYYWPTMHADAKKEVDKCDSCQIISPIQDPKTNDIHHAPWPFYQWGMDILGPLTPARGGANLPRIIVTDNGAQLVNEPFKGWCTRFKIQQMNTSVAHPQANGLVERANRSLMEGIKTRLGRERAGWVDELPNVLYEAVIPAEIGIPSYRTLMIREEYNEEQRLNLDLLQERREAAIVREAKYKTKMEQYYNKRVCPAGFRPGEFVYRRNEASRMEDEGKLGPNWEGPYRVTEAHREWLHSHDAQQMEDKEVLETKNMATQLIKQMSTCSDFIVL
ncbi:reverse transcriptase domain-containing protein [Tanacetum coccineum]